MQVKTSPYFSKQINVMISREQCIYHSSVYYGTGSLFITDGVNVKTNTNWVNEPSFVRQLIANI